MAEPKLILLMGPSGCGKSTVGPLLAARIAGIYLEGDDFHPPENKARMGAGIPLRDEDRWPWFANLRAAIDAAFAENPERPVVASCSALKRAYREALLRGGREHDARLVFLRGAKDLIASRLGDRVHEYMPATLLDSQFATLEEPGDDENALVIDIGPTPETLAKELASALGF